MKINFKTILLSFFIAIIFVLPLQAKAISLPSFLPNCEKTVYIVSGTGNFTVDIPGQGKKQAVWPENYSTANGEIVQVYVNRACGFNDFVQLFINGYNFGLAILGLVVLFFFIFGGFTLLISGGRANKVQEGKDIIKGAFYGTLVVFTGWMLVNFYIAALSGNTKGLIFNKLWWGGQDCHETYKEKCDKNNLYEGCGGEIGSLTDTYVKQLQTALNSKGCDCGTVDGCFGPKTKECVVNFQFTNNIIQEIGEANAGKVDQTTWDTLNSLNQAGVKDACLENYQGYDDLMKDIGLPETDLKYCCEPNLTDCPNCACDQTADKTCGGLTKKIGPISGEPLYTSSEKSCWDSAICNWGCCVPYLPDNCTTTVSTRCDGITNYFKKGVDCSTLSDCKWAVCMAGINDCLYQRLSCPAGYQNVGMEYTKESAKNAIGSVEECNYGTCVLPLSKSCAWTSAKKCTSIQYTDFYPNIIIDPSTNLITGTNQECDPNNPLNIP